MRTIHLRASTLSACFCKEPHLAERMMASGVRKPSRQAEQMPANGQPANDQLKSLAKGAPSTDARISDHSNPDQIGTDRMSTRSIVRELFQK